MLLIDQLFQVFIDEDSEEKDIVIKMYQPIDNEEERFFCVDVGEEAVDFLAPEEYPPTRFVLNIPSALIKASSMEITSIQRTTKDLAKQVETLRNSTPVSDLIEVQPPPESVNHDGASVFFDSVHIKPMIRGDSQFPPQPRYLIGKGRDEGLQITVIDQNATVKSDSSSE